MQKYSLSFKDHSCAAFSAILTELSPIQFKYIYDIQTPFYQHIIKNHFGFNVDNPVYQIPKEANRKEIKEQICIVIDRLYATGKLLHTKKESRISKMKSYFQLREYKKIARSITGSSDLKNIENLSYILRVLNELYIRFGTTTIDYVFFREDGFRQYIVNTYLFYLIAGYNIKEMLSKGDFVDKDDLFELIVSDIMSAIQEGCTSKEIEEKIDAIIKENEALVEA